MPNVKLSDLPVAELKKELARREKNQGKLRKQRARLVRQLEAIDRELGEAPVARKARKAKPGRKAKPAKAKAPAAKAPKAAKKSRKRPKNTMTLPEAMRSVMSKELPMGVKDISAAVTAAGYKSNSKTFDTIIYQALKKDKRFVKASRGRYVLGE